MKWWDPRKPAASARWNRVLGWVTSLSTELCALSLWEASSGTRALLRKEGSSWADQWAEPDPAALVSRRGHGRETPDTQEALPRQGSPSVERDLLQGPVPSVGMSSQNNDGMHRTSPRCKEAARSDQNRVILTRGFIHEWTRMQAVLASSGSTWLLCSMVGHGEVRSVRKLVFYFRFWIVIFSGLVLYNRSSLMMPRRGSSQSATWWWG